MDIIIAAIISGIFLFIAYILTLIQAPKTLRWLNILWLICGALGILTDSNDFIEFCAVMGLFLVPLTLIVTLVKRLNKTSSPSNLSSHLRPLLLLRQKLSSQYQQDIIDEKEYQTLTDALNPLLDEATQAIPTTPTQRKREIAAAWLLVEARLKQHAEQQQHKPHQKPTQARTETPSIPTPAHGNEISTEIDEADFELPDTPVRSEAAPKTVEKPAYSPYASDTPISSAPAYKHIQVPTQPHVPTPARAVPTPARVVPTPAHGNEVKQPNRWQQLQNQSQRWLLNILLPFLWQNIGWFIGGFCLVSGSIFLVTYTSGYNKALAVLGVLLFYTALMFWGGYQIQRHYPKKYQTSQTLLILGILLIPLNFATATRLILLADGLMQGTLALVLSVLTLFGLGFAARLASGLMQRSLNQTHAPLFILLSSLQFGLPVLLLLPHWSSLMAAHVVLLAVLAYALWSFSTGWLYTLYEEKKQLAWYVVGTLVYSSVISFVHLTWSATQNLPNGYFGPFLMALCALLLYADLQIKAHIDKKIWLNSLSFVLYALPVVALLLALLPDAQIASALLPLSLVLLLACLFYATLLWHSLSLPPLALLLTSFSALYAIWVLRFTPADTHFLLSLPGLAAILGLYRVALKRQAESVARQIQHFLLGLIPVLVLWSLWQASPSWSSMLTPLSAVLALMLVLRIPLTSLSTLQKTSAAWRWKCYLPLLFMVLTLAYTPVWTALWSQQFSAALLLLSTLWVLWAIKIRDLAQTICHSEVLVNASLLSLSAATLLAFYHLDGGFTANLLMSGGALLLLLSLSFRSRFLLVSALLAWAVSAVLFIQFYNIVTTGQSGFILAILLFMLLWWLERRQESQIMAVDLDNKDTENWRLSLLWLLPLRASDYSSKTEMVLPVLQWSFVLLWLFGTAKLIGSLFFAGNTFTTPAELWLMLSLPAQWFPVLALAMLVTLIQAGRSRYLSPLIPLATLFAVVLLCSLSAPLLDISLLRLAVISIALWLVGTALAHQGSWLWNTLGWRGGYDRLDSRVGGGTFATELYLHWSVALLLLFALLSSFAFPELGISNVLLVLNILFFAVTGQRYQLSAHAYLVVAGISVLCFNLFMPGLLSSHHWLFAEAAFFWMLLSFSLIVISLLLRRWQQDNAYIAPLHDMAWLLYILSFGLLLWQPVFSGFQFKAVVLPWMSATLALAAITLLPLLAPQKNKLASHLRGLWMPLFLSLALLLALNSYPLFHLEVFMVWGFILWANQHFVLPHWNSAYPSLAINPLLSVQLGFLFVLGAFIGQWWETVLPVLPLPDNTPPMLEASLTPLLALLAILQDTQLLLFAGLTLYSLFMLTSPRTRFPGLNNWTAVLITLLGLSVLLHIFPIQGSLPKALIIGAILWLNALLYLGYRQTDHIPAWLRSQQKLLRRLAAALLSACWLMVFIPLLIKLADLTYEGMWSVEPYTPLLPTPSFLVTGFTLLLLFSFLHWLWQRPNWLNAQLIHLTVLTLLLLALAPLLGLSLLLIGWAGLLWLLFYHFAIGMQLSDNATNNPSPPQGEARRGAIKSASLFSHESWQWLNKTALFNLYMGFILALAGWVVVERPLWETLLSLLALIALSSVIHWTLPRSASVLRWGWSVTSVGLLLFALHWIWFLFLPFSVSETALLPWFALEMVLLLWLLRWLKPLQQNLPGFFTSWVLGLLVLEWLLHFWWYYQALAGSYPASVLFGIFDTVAALSALGLLVLYWLDKYPLSTEQGVYRLLGLALLAALYLRLQWLGLAPLGVIDTSACLILAAILILWAKKPAHPAAVSHFALLLPALAILSAPLQLASEHASIAWISAATLYLLLSRSSGKRHSLPLYLGLLALNLGLYLWIPAWVDKTQLLQLYIVPAAITVLLMLQLHWLELKPSTTHNMRLAALSALYAAATLDVFLQPGLGIFMLTLGLSFGGILIGILWQQRAFLYSGVAFLLLNVCGQLLQHYPEETLGKAIILMAAGGLIIGSMIGFSLQREWVLEKISRMQANLRQWE
ncbi:hypothetical protein [Candidatus Venteria ishoeyi]|uniref:Uncharacterized protein n=1 Tax=Candidatus Venteria ishoeyi TaxID=1899563 RepID=A0A1H6FAG0_9GAMM|nr:hypothetical protein [Candidatus Venteria ishoeyi]SEH07092.1 Uncharacterised protein [Candidatus Venteria ishoeyi]